MIYLIILLIFMPTVLAIAITPYITRKTESFGISIPEEIYGDSQLVEFRKKYAFRTSIFGVILLAVSILPGQFFEEEIWMMILFVALMLFPIGSFMIYLQFHKKMKKMKATSNWQESKIEATMIDTNFRNRKLTHSNGWFIIPLLITAATFAITIINYDKIPNQIPMHYDLKGEIDRWATKSYGSVFALPLTQLFMLGMFIFINGTISRSRQQVDPSNPEKSIMQNVIFRRRWSAFMIFTGTGMVILFGLMQLPLFFTMDVKLLTSASLILTGAVVLAAVILSIITGQGGSRVKIAVGKHGEKINRDEDRFWKLGVFYFNSADPAIWVEKRFGSGWTVNMAKPQAWIFFLVIIAVPILISLLA